MPSETPVPSKGRKPMTPRDWLLLALVGLAVLSGVAGWFKASQLEGKLSTVVAESANTRVTTVTQRCGLTVDVQQLTHLSASVITEFAPKIATPFDLLNRTLVVSYNGCEKQLKAVKSIAKQAP